MSRVPCLLASLVCLAISCHRPLPLDFSDEGARDDEGGRDANGAPQDAKDGHRDGPRDAGVAAAAVCGNGKIEGNESCDDGNTVPYDGCSATCQTEPACQGGACNTRCGDGVVLGEDCDDGNRVNGDGCSADCHIEPGFVCLTTQPGATMTIPVVYRDFRADHLEFEPGALGLNAATTGIVADRLDGDGKPVFTGLTGAYVVSQQTFARWYRDVPGVNSTTAGQLILWKDARGTYVNRWGAHGEQWEKPYGDRTLMDGNPVYFAVDGDPFTPDSERHTATIAPYFAGTSSWPLEAGGKLHNFHFTSELRHWFLFDASKTYVLEFLGDDDVWVFINGRLAVDLGGIHAPVSGSVTLDASTAAKFGVAHGNLYELAVFHAERQTTGSSYMLSLSGFGAASSVCHRQ